MRIFNFFRRSPRPEPKPNSRRNHTLHLESLEDRALPSAALPLGAGTPAPAVQSPTITDTTGSGQSVFAGYSFQTLRARVTENGQGVAGVPVTFTAPAGGAGGFFGLLAPSATIQTDAYGWATAPIFTANATAGAYNVTASSSGAAGTGTFTLSNLPDSMLTFPFGAPTLVDWQITFDMKSLPLYTTPQAKSDLSNQFGAWFAYAYLQSPQQAVQLFWNEVSLMETFIRDFPSYFTRETDPPTVYQGLNLIANPLYNTLAGYGMGLLESELILVSVV
jgi:hypothetical protein